MGIQEESVPFNLPEPGALVFDGSFFLLTEEDIQNHNDQEVLDILDEQNNEEAPALRRLSYFQEAKKKKRKKKKVPLYRQDLYELRYQQWLQDIHEKRMAKLSLKNPQSSAEFGSSETRKKILRDR